MATHTQDRICTTVVEKLTQGEHLNETEKAHLGQCADCMREVILKLAEKAGDPTISLEKRDNSQAEPNDDSEVGKAREHSRRVLAREFGL